MVGATPSPNPNQGVRVRACVRAVGEGGAGLALYLTDPSAAAVTLALALALALTLTLTLPLTLTLTLTLTPTLTRSDPTPKQVTQGRAEAAPGMLTADHMGQEQTADVSTPGELTADAAARTPDPAARRPLLTPMAGGDVCSSTRVQAAPPNEPEAHGGVLLAARTLLGLSKAAPDA